MIIMLKFNRIAAILSFIFLLELSFICIGIRNNKYASTSIGIDKYTSKKPMVIVIDVSSNLLTVFQDGNALKTYQIAGGKPSTPSPIGTWQIVSKGLWNEGFGGHWMGFNVPWGKFGIHGTIFPNSIGWNSSHGCIRMKNDDVAELYKITPYGTTVIIWGGPYGNFGQSLRTIRPGFRGADVYEVQKILKNKGYYNGIPTGIYDENMKKILHKYQKDNNLPISDSINVKFYSSLGIYLID